MTPTSSDENSPLATLRELKHLLDTGAITQPEFDVLKQRLLFGSEAGSPAAPAAAAPASPGEPAGTTPASPAEAAPPTPYLDTPAALTPEATPLLAPEPDWLAAPAPALLSPGPDEPAPAEAAGRRNPLNLIFALGGLLLFLAVVAYLVYDRRPDEHVSSQTQTAADSTTAAPEVGPQAEQLTLPPAAAPETVRVAPAPQPAALPALPDSLAAQPSQPAAPAPAATPAPKSAAAAKPATTTTITTDSTTTQPR